MWWNYLQDICSMNLQKLLGTGSSTVVNEQLVPVRSKLGKNVERASLSGHSQKFLRRHVKSNFLFPQVGWMLLLLICLIGLIPGVYSSRVTVTRTVPSGEPGASNSTPETTHLLPTRFVRPLLRWKQGTVLCASSLTDFSNQCCCLWPSCFCADLLIDEGNS